MCAVVWVSSSSCKKQQLLESGGDIRFSEDTVAFDTVFTALGSATQIVKIFNKQDQKIVLSSVRLENGQTSFFSLNVDGKQGKAVSDIEIGANDSIYVFATVKVDPTSENTPFIIEDRLIATLNGNDFSIPMMAYGQNAHFVTDSVLSTQTWGDKDTKPYVVFGYAVVDSAETLTIAKGCRIYMHANARLFVAGTLKAIGTKQDSIIFQGDRLDRRYYGFEGYPGEWGGLYFTEHSVNNELRHVILQNGGNAAQGAPAAMIEVAPNLVAGQDYQLTLDDVIIRNSNGYGLLSFAGSIKATNCLMHSCGANTLALVQGGYYSFDHCTIATYGNSKISHNDNSAAIILNYFVDANKNIHVSPLSAMLRNCIISGSLSNELVADDTNLAPSSFSFINCAMRADKSKLKPAVVNTNPVFLAPGPSFDSLFRNIARDDYHLTSSSPVIGKGAPIGVTLDMDDKLRSLTAPDIGCYEH